MARKVFAHLGTLTIATKNKKDYIRNVSCTYSLEMADAQGGGTYWKYPVPTKREVSIDLSLISTISSAGLCKGRNLEVTAWTAQIQGAGTTYDFLADWESGSISIQNDVQGGEAGSSDWIENQIMGSSVTIKGTMKLPKTALTGAQAMFLAAVMEASLAWGTSCAIADHTFLLSLAFSGSTFTSSDGTFVLQEATLTGSTGNFFTIDVTFVSRGAPHATAFHAEAVGAADALRELAFEVDSTSVATFVMATAANNPLTGSGDLNITGTNMIIESYDCSFSSGQVTTESMKLRSSGNNVAVTAI